MPHNGAADSTPLVFGEVLFDHFVDGSRVLGGAPFNVAWHLRGLGSAPLVVSAVGADDAGQEALDRMSQWGMDTRAVQVDPLHPTGRVTATLVDGEPTFEIGSEQAYDYIDGPAAVAALNGATASILYHGTLALRSDRSWEAARTLRASTGAPTFVDLNLRDPWWTPERLRWCLNTASWLKLNETELAEVAGTLGTDRDACVEGALRLIRTHGLEGVFVTRGSRGALAAAGEQLFEAEAVTVPSDELVDTVGAGDAFSAVACTGILLGWSLETVLHRGAAFAADICRIRGALTQDRHLYDRHRQAWGGS